MMESCNARRLLALVLLGVLTSQAAIAQNDEHPFVMPGTPEKVIPAPSPWLTGAQLLQQLDPPQDAPGREAIIREAVKYIMGVYDVSESALWCYTDYKLRPRPKQPPEVMRASAINYFRKQPPKVLRGRAAVLIVQMWQNKWPCPPEGCCPSVADNEGRR